MFQIIGNIQQHQPVAIGASIRELNRLRKAYGPGRWRKMKGIATVELPTGIIRKAEIHWYEAHGVGRKEYKIKHFLD